MCHRMREHKATDNAAKQIEHESDQASGPSHQLAGSTRMEKHIELQGEDEVNKIQAVGNSTSQMEVLQQTACKDKEKKR